VATGNPERLHEEAVKPRNDISRVDHEILELLHYGHAVHGLPISEKYVEGELCLHVHIQPRGSGAVMSDWCAVYERASELLASDGLAVDRDVLEPPDQGLNEIQASVLVDDVSRVDQPERRNRASVSRRR
jgi:hypothetical protein